jgi:hypothetical protein
MAQQGHVIVRSGLQFGLTAYGNLGHNALFQVGIEPFIGIQLRACDEIPGGCSRYR